MGSGLKKDILIQMIGIFIGMMNKFGVTHGADQIRHVWELVNGYDRNAVPVVCPNCKEKIREDAISYCINCSDTKKICLLCCSDVYEMYCKECGEKER